MESIPWVRCASGNVYSDLSKFIPVLYLHLCWSCFFSGYFQFSNYDDKPETFFLFFSGFFLFFSGYFPTMMTNPRPQWIVGQLLANISETERPTVKWLFKTTYSNGGTNNTTIYKIYILKTIYYEKQYNRNNISETGKPSVKQLFKTALN